MHNIRVFSQRSAWAPYMRLQELRSNTHLGVTGPQKWPLSLKKGKSGRQKIKSWYFYCPYVFLKCLQCTFWRNQTVSFSGLSSSLTRSSGHCPCCRMGWVLELLLAMFNVIQSLVSVWELGLSLTLEYYYITYCGNSLLHNLFSCLINLCLEFLICEGLFLTWIFISY